ncbi:type II secretion system minor pseudopilin GspI [Limnohabitans sp.]|uniref:type II secretion system minor pseudopilin GspI n=1 Tax=Limnohabitans sp. TaxID=1907725 RepID=UPI00286F556B|nr:type II secretion system minor pseudopilin GspI [Limnohabitans sp.]
MNSSRTRARASPLCQVTRRPNLAHGFTLIEVLVALAIVSIALMSGLKVSGALTRNAQRQTDVMLAQICADNALNQLRLSQQLPSVGDNRVACPQVERNFEVALTVRTTPNPAFRRIDAQVFDAATPVLNITTVLGRY